MKSSKSILLIEDDKDDQEFFLEALGEIENATLYDVAGNGKEALSKLQNLLVMPDIIFMDINMPEMGGIECLKEISKHEHTRDIPVVILSSATDEATHARSLGAKAFIKKPLDAKTMLAKLTQMINMDFIVDRVTANRTFQSMAAA
jgi:CheY-like chemotaxis protein